MEQLIFSLPDFRNGNKFPIEYTGRGEDLSPEIVIENLSDNAKTLYALGYLEYSCGKQNRKGNTER